MIISKLVEELNKMKAERGDVPVCFTDDLSPPQEVRDVDFESIGRVILY